VVLFSRLILLGLKLRKESTAYTLLNILTIKGIIKLIVMYVHFENIGSTRNGIQRNIKSFMRTEANKSTYL